MPSAILAEDEPALLAELQRLLNTEWVDLDIVATVTNGRDACDAIESCKPDIAFLDIQMPKPDGIEIAERFGNQLAVVFVTAYSEYAINAFEHAAVDYLLKPITRERMRKTIVRLKETLRNRKIGEVDFSALSALIRSTESNYLTWLRVGEKDAIKVINVTDVCFFDADAKYTSTFTKDREYLLRIPISTLEQQLNPERFWRIHRSTIVNVAAIDEASRDFRRRIKVSLKDRDEVLNVSKPYEHLFLKH